MITGALLYYVLSTIGSLSVLLLLASLLNAIWWAVATMVHDDQEHRSRWRDGGWQEKLDDMVMKCKESVKLLFIASIFFVVVPSTKTVYTMIGAGAAYGVISMEETQEIPGNVASAMNKFLESYVEEDEE